MKVIRLLERQFEGLDSKRMIAWALYDCANSAFATTVMAGFFPVFFKQYWSAESTVAESTLRLGIANSVAGILVAAMAPLLGAIADQGNVKKKFLFSFCYLGVVMTASLYFVQRDNWFLAALLYVFGAIGFSGANVFYDSLLISVSHPKRVDFVSAFGYATGYLGGGLLFLLNTLMVTHPQAFGITDASSAVRISFLIVALWWALFSLPLFTLVSEPRVSDVSKRSNVAAGLRQLLETFRRIRELKMVSLFLLGYWLYIDGVDTIVRMAVDYGLSLGFDSNSLVIALLVTQFIGFPAAILFGKIGERYGPKTGIYIGIGVYIAVTIYAYSMSEVSDFYTLAVAVGLVQGGIQSLSRSLYTRLIPQEKAAEFFGFYNMLGKFAVVIGPVMMGVVGSVTGNPRASILSVILLFASGGILLTFVKVPSR